MVKEVDRIIVVVGKHNLVDLVGKEEELVDIGEAVEGAARDQ